MIRLAPIPRPFFSIIVPMHNAADSVHACLESVVRQDFTDFELIVVDDSSTDGSVEAVRAFGLEPFSVKAGSPGEARNAGLAHARGRYIAFLDVDDTLASPTVLSRIHAAVVDQGMPDILHFGFYYGDTSTGVWGNGGNPWPNVWSRVWRAELLQGFQFSSDRFGEDLDFCRRVFPSADRHGVLDEPLIRYSPPKPGSLSWEAGLRPPLAPPPEDSAVPPTQYRGNPNAHDCSVLILSCDAYADLWDPFFLLFQRYWNCPYPVYIATETLECRNARALKHKGPWTRRIQESLREISSTYVIIMCDDFFLQSEVNQEVIDYALSHFSPTTATFNFEKTYDPYDVDSDVWGFKRKTQGSQYKCSCQAGVWSREKLIALLDRDEDAWTWETRPVESDFDFYINDSSLVFNYGYQHYEWFGVRKGRWVPTVVDLFEREGIEVDYARRGFYEEEER